MYAILIISCNPSSLSRSLLQEDCLANTEHCYSLARLVALQLNLLQLGKQVINLEPKRVNKFMEEQPFNEVVILDAC